MDSDNDGEISSGAINIRVLDNQLISAFKPLFNELEVLQQPLDREEFVDAAIRLYDVSLKKVH